MTPGTSLGRPVRLDAATLIDLAERASEQSPGVWSVTLLERALPGAGRDAILALPLGARDRLILETRARLTGEPPRCEPVCGECGETYQLTLDPAALGLAGEAPWPVAGACSVEIGHRRVRLRPVSVADVIAVERVAAPGEAARLLALRVAGEDASDVSVDELSEALESIDPAADVWLDTACPECGATQSAAFDPVHFVAHELRLLSHRILRDVVEIARVFHWSERDILALPEHRRAYYVAEALA